jgi:preprotein translocase subunit SecG
MLFLIILFTVAMVIDCIILVFLVLMQLPKKEAGAGLAFGAGATDALFGAGSGNFLTKATKYAAGIFFALALLLGVMQSHRAHQPGSDFLERVKQHQSEQPAIAPLPAPTTPAAASEPPPIVAPATNFLLSAGPATNSASVTAPSNAAPVAPAQK